MTIANITFGSEQFVSYATVDEADDYLSSDPTYSSLWTDSSPDVEVKERFLVYAARLIDRFDYIGDKEDDNQTSAFPRDLDIGLPQSVVEANILLAASFIVIPPALSSPVNSRIKKVTAGSVDVEFFSKNPGEFSNSDLIVNPSVIELLRPYFKEVPIRASVNVSDSSSKMNRGYGGRRFRKRILA